MNKLLFGCALAVSSFQASSTFAQDLCYSPPCDPCCYGSDFNGLYFGGNVGAFSHTAFRNDLDGLYDNSGYPTINTNITGGIQLGYDWQCGNTLVGIVGDWNWVNNRHELDLNENASPTTINSIKSDWHWFSTIRARFGVTMCNALVYVTAGGAASRFHNRWSGLFIDPEIVDREYDFHQTRWGWVGGAGTEFLLGCNWSFGLEVLWLHFDEYDRTFNNLIGSPNTFGHSDSSLVGRVTLNYRFGNLCCF